MSDYPRDQQDADELDARHAASGARIHLDRTMDGPLKPLCWETPPLTGYPDGTTPMMHCDRVKGHTGDHSWMLQSLRVTLEAVLKPFATQAKERASTGKSQLQQGRRRRRG